MGLLISLLLMSSACQKGESGATNEAAQSGKAAQGADSKARTSEMNKRVYPPPRRSSSPSEACYKLDCTRYALTNSPLTSESLKCWEGQFESFGLCVCQSKFPHKYDLPDTREKIKEFAISSARLFNFEAALQAYCALYDHGKWSQDEVIYMIKLLNAAKDCRRSMDCVNNLFSACPIIAGHTDN